MYVLLNENKMWFFRGGRVLSWLELSEVEIFLIGHKRIFVNVIFNTAP